MRENQVTKRLLISVKRDYRSTTMYRSPSLILRLNKLAFRMKNETVYHGLIKDYLRMLRDTLLPPPAVTPVYASIESQGGCLTGGSLVIQSSITK